VRVGGGEGESDFLEEKNGGDVMLRKLAIAV
jgi:hypothetical protein